MALGPPFKGESNERNILGASAICLLVSATPLLAQTPLKELEAKGLRPLANEELGKFLPGNTLYHVNQAKGIKVPLYYVPDGTRYVRLRGQVIATATHRFQIAPAVGITACQSN